MEVENICDHCKGETSIHILQDSHFARHVWALSNIGVGENLLNALIPDFWIKNQWGIKENAWLFAMTRCKLLRNRNKHLFENSIRSPLEGQRCFKL